MGADSVRTESFTVSTDAPAAAARQQAPGTPGAAGASRAAPGRGAQLRRDLAGHPYAEQQRMLKPGPLPRTAEPSPRTAEPAPRKAAAAVPDTGRASGGRRRAAPTVRIGRVRRGHLDVTGSTLAELDAQLPPDELGSCEWDWGYSAGYDDDGNASRVTVTLTLRTTMPRWRGPGRRRASDAARTEWDRCMGALDVHENGHADLARAWAPRLREALLGHPEADLPDLWEQAKSDHEQAQEDYDAANDHGRAQGATLDLSVEPAPEPEAEP